MLLVFFMNQFPPRPRVLHLDRFKFFRKFAERFAIQGAPPVSTTPAAKLPLVSTTPVATFSTIFASVVDTGGKFATSVNNTGCKFATGVNDAGGKLPPVSTTPAANLPPVSTTPHYGLFIVLVAEGPVQRRAPNSGKSALLYFISCENHYTQGSRINFFVLLIPTVPYRM